MAYAVGLPLTGKTHANPTQERTMTETPESPNTTETDGDAPPEETLDTPQDDQGGEGNEGEGPAEGDE